MTDREAVKLALFLAIEWERSTLGSDPSETDADACRRRIRVFERVLDRHYGGARFPQPDGGKPITLMELLGFARKAV